jgi:hypothetical protein
MSLDVSLPLAHPAFLVRHGRGGGSPRQLGTPFDQAGETATGFRLVHRANCTSLPR